MRSYLPAAAVAASLAAGAASAHAATLIHSYNLNGSYADSLGGPSLVANGGTLGADTYSFGVNQGLSLSGALPNAGDYSIELYFHFDTTSGYRKILDFKDRTADAGLYDHDGSLNFFPPTSGAPGAIPPGQDVHVVITRNAGSNNTVGYVNGNLQWFFNDSTSLATFSAPNNIIHFFRDDAIQNAEASAGAVDFIRIYDGPLTDSEAHDLSADDLPAAVPTPAAASAGLALLGLLAFRAPRRARLA